MTPTTRIELGIAFDGQLCRPYGESGRLWLGPKGFLHWLEYQLGLDGRPEKTDYLRVELYRQSLQQYLSEATAPPFYVASFEADRFATAQALLERRDQLRAAGFNFELAPECPQRIATFSAVERIYALKINDPANNPFALGDADRFQIVCETLKTRNLPPVQITLHDPVEDFGLQIADLGIADLRIADLGNSAHSTAELIVLRARRDSDAAVFVAQLLAANPKWRPALLLPQLDRTLEDAMIAEGLPALGVLSASPARPALQVLKLAPAFLWDPVDVFKIMEFATLPLKPLDRGLSLEIARVLAEKPGLFSDTWFAAVLGYLDKTEQHASRETAREQYQFWFDRRRYHADGACPKREAIAIYAYIRAWALENIDNNARDGSLIVLAEQARRICELLEALPEQRITPLELERIVRTIYEPAPAGFELAETGCLSYFHQEGALTQPVEDLIWWNCVDQSGAPEADFWSAAERQWLLEKNCRPYHPQTKTAAQIRHRKRLLSRVTKRLILAIPEQVYGETTHPHLLSGDLEAAYGDLDAISFNIDHPADLERLKRHLHPPAKETVAQRNLWRPKPFIQVPQTALIPLDTPDHPQSPTSLEDLFYYPHQWFFQRQLRLYPSNVLSVTRENRLLGTLAHRFFELLLKQPIEQFDRDAVHQWVNDSANTLLFKEGATLLLYGREPERESFLRKIKNAAWSLIHLIKSNGWSVQATEKELNGRFAGCTVKGKADLVLTRGDEQAVIDLKWGGANRRKALLGNEEDLQLVLYAHLLPPEGYWPHTAYFIIEQGMMIARNKLAFSQAQTVGGQEDHGAVCDRIFQRMETTLQWRLKQIEDGRLEIRTDRTLDELAALYENEPMLDRLEMRHESARWDEYRAIIEFMG